MLPGCYYYYVARRRGECPGVQYDDDDDGISVYMYNILRATLDSQLGGASD